MTPTDLIKRTLRSVVRVLGRGQNADAEQYQEALEILNSMMGKWARERWLVFHLMDLKVQGTGATAYFLGPNGSFSITDSPNQAWDVSGITWDGGFRTNRIERAYVRLNPGTPQQTDIPITVIRAYEDWAAIPAKNVTGGLPQTVFLESGYPVATLNVFPALSTSYELHILIQTPLVRFNALDTDINLPDEYQEALVYNLALRLFEAYGKPVSPNVERLAAAALHTVKTANLQIPSMGLPGAILPLGGGGYNFYTDR